MKRDNGHSREKQATHAKSLSHVSKMSRRTVCVKKLEIFNATFEGHLFFALLVKSSKKKSILYLSKHL